MEFGFDIQTCITLVIIAALFAAAISGNTGDKK